MIPLYPSFNETYIRVVSPLLEYPVTPQALDMVFSLSLKPLFSYSHTCLFFLIPKLLRTNKFDSSAFTIYFNLLYN